MDLSLFNHLHEGIEVQLYHLKSDVAECYITNYGARIVSMKVRDTGGHLIDVVLGFDSLDSYLKVSEQYHGATVGRYANRIGGAQFTLNENVYKVTPTFGNFCLHGGIEGFHKKVWSVIEVSDSSILMTTASPHMEEGFPGDMIVHVRYTLIESTIVIHYKAISSLDTVINLTHHSYFNLNGEGSGHVLDHKLKINAEKFTPVDCNLVPTGELSMVNDTPFDFSNFKAIGADIDHINEQLILGKGYDHNYVINNYETKQLNYVASVVGNISKIKMDVWSTEPGVQLYTANHFDGSDIGKSGTAYDFRHAFCLETQHFPDSPNRPEFPSVLLEKGVQFESTTEYRFGLSE